MSIKAAKSNIADVVDKPVFSVSEGRRFISEDRKEGDVYDTLHLGTKISLLSKTLYFYINFTGVNDKVSQNCLFRPPLAMIVQIHNLYFIFVPFQKRVVRTQRS